MAKEDFKQRVLEEQLFNELKDTNIKGARYLRAKYEGSGIDITRLHRRIVNYQIKVYGNTLDNYVPYRNTEECKRISHKARARKRYWRYK